MIDDLSNENLFTDPVNNLTAVFGPEKISSEETGPTCDYLTGDTIREKEC